MNDNELKEKISNLSNSDSKTKGINLKIFTLIGLICWLAIIGVLGFIVYSVVDGYKDESFSSYDWYFLRDFIYYWNILFIFGFTIVFLFKKMNIYIKIIKYKNMLPLKTKKLNSRFLAIVISIIISSTIFLIFYLLENFYDSSDIDFKKLLYPNIGIESSLIFKNEMITIAIIYFILICILLFFYIITKKAISKYEYKNNESATSHLNFATMSINLVIIFIPIIPIIFTLIIFYKKFKKNKKTS